MKRNENDQVEAEGFSSSDSVIIIEDRPGDTTMRPARPALKKLLDAEREKIRRWRNERSNPNADDDCDTRNQP